MAPFLSGGGYSSEAWSYITALDTHIKDPKIRLRVEQHGDLESSEFWVGLPEGSKALAFNLHNTKCPMSETIVVCHSEPGAWYPPLFDTFPCPPTGYEEPLFVVGRTMFETDRVSAGHVKRCNRMDAVWVPTDFHVSTFVRSGVDPAKVVKMIQPVDVEFFDPSKHEALVLPTGAPVFGTHAASMNSNSGGEGKEFVFLSIFKWEQRKGWDVLLKAYMEEFSKADGVALYLLINAYHSGRDFGSRIVEFVTGNGIKEPGDGWALVHVIDFHVPQSDLPGLYKAADAFVLPSRGEGWGRPIVEAMAMALPVIATNWSGPTEYLTEENGYPLPVDRMSRVVEGPFEGHFWAEPSVERLRVLMRHVASNPGEGRRKGRRARQDMIGRFSPEIVAGLVADQVLKIWRNRNQIPEGT